MATSVCRLCYTLLKPTLFNSTRRTFSTSRQYNFNSSDPTGPPIPSSSSTSSNPNPSKSLQTIRLEKLQTQLTQILQSAKTKSGTTIKSWELERKFGEMGGKINRATGYEEIERLRLGVAQKEKALTDVRDDAVSAKKVYAQAMALRSASQREVNDLLQRKSSWSSGDVIRFTELIQQDHENERAEAAAKQLMDLREEGVEKGFSDLMQGILERYHEEQVWSDKIRSMSTYGSLAITSLNLLLFIIAILLVEPWKRKRLVEGVESRLRANTIQSHEATLSSLSVLESLIASTQSKLDQLLPPPPNSTDSSEEEPSIEIPSQTQGVDDLLIYPSSTEIDDNIDAVEENVSGKEDQKLDILGIIQIDKLERNQELWIVGISGTVIGVGVSLLMGLLSR